MEKEFKNIDDLLRDTLNGLEKKPSDGVWANISSTLHGSGKSGIFTSAYLWSVIGLLGLVVIFYFLSNEQKNVIPGEEISQPVQLESIEGQNTERESVAINKSNKITPETANQPGGKNKGEHIFRNENDNKPSQPVNAINDNSTGLAISEQTGKNEGLNDQIIKNETYLLTGYFPFLMKRTFAEEPPQVIYPAIMRPQFVRQRNATQSFQLSGLELKGDDYGKKSNLIYGINIIPELIFPGSGKVNKSIGLEITGRYILNEVFLETGLGLNISEDDGKFAINYTQYDSIGFYYKVNSFTIDQSSGQPVFNTGVEAVYDTIGYAAQQTKRNTYTYLYLPLSAGVNLYQFKRFSVNIQAGLIYSLIVAKNEQHSDYENENATSIDITNETPARITSNWLLKTSVGLQYQLTPKISLNIEPQFKYYIIPVYEQRYNPKPTFGGGLRMGLYFNF